MPPPDAEIPGPSSKYWIKTSARPDEGRRAGSHPGIARDAVRNVMSKAVRFDSYGGYRRARGPRRSSDRHLAAGEVLVEVKAAGINPGEAMIRRGLLARPYGLPRSRPDKAVTSQAWSPKPARVSTTVTAGDEVIGFTDNRASQARIRRRACRAADCRNRHNVPWEVAGALFVAGTTAYAAVRAVALKPGDTVAVAGAAGGVGTIAVQLAKRAGATVLGIAGPSNDDWLTAHGVDPGQLR